MDARREKIVEVARGLIDTRWRHQGRDPEKGLDCVGLVIWVGWELGLVPRDFDFGGYRRQPDGKALARALGQQAVEKSWTDREPGDIVLLRDISTVWPCHMGLLATRPGSQYPTLIHSWAKIRRRVVEVRFDEEWQSRMVGLYSYKELS